jgi:hypothetical protein
MLAGHVERDGQMIRMMAVLLVVCLLLSAMTSSAYAAKIQKTELSPSEAHALAQAQAASAHTINVTSGGGVGEALLGGFAIIGAVVVILIVIAAAK